MRHRLRVAAGLILGTLITWMAFPGLIQSQVKPVLYDAGLLPAAQASSSGEDNTLFFPAIGLTSVPVSYAPQSDPFDPNVWQLLHEQLLHGVSLTYTNADFATAPSIYVIGHSSDTTEHSYAHIFAGLYQAKPHDEIKIKSHGISYTYTVTETKVLAPTDVTGFQALTVPSNVHAQRLILVTCWPLFTTKQRLVVIAERER